MSDSRGSVSFFVPCLNEEGNIGRRPYEIIVVDDASLDGTTEATMVKTIELGRTLATDILKISICIPFQAQRCTTSWRNGHVE